jgi:hypothetical protein
MIREDPDLEVAVLGAVTLADLAPGPHREALLRRRAGLGLTESPDALVLVDHHGNGYSPGDVPLALRRARSTRISIDGNAHFCRGLLRTRYPDSGADQAARTDGAEPADAAHDPTFIPLTSLLKEHTP